MSAEPQTKIDFMSALRERYVADLGEQEKHFRDALNTARAGDSTDEIKEALRARAHKLAGNGATYGFPDISRAAAALETLLESETTVSRDALVFHLGNLIDSLIAAHTTAPTDQDLPPPRSNRPEKDRRDLKTGEVRPKVLIVDHDHEARDGLIGILLGKADISTASDADDALDHMKKSRPDLVLLGDLGPADVLALELLEQIREIEDLRTLHILMITSRYDSKSVMRAHTAGALEYIVKPYDTGKVKERLMTHLRRLTKTIFIVDDDRAICDLLARKFTAAGYHTMAFEDGLSALSEIDEVRPDLVVLDKVMPGLDGMMVLEKMRELDLLRDTAVVMLSARRQQSDIFKGFDLGAADYIVKPFNPQELANRCINLLKTRKRSTEEEPDKPA